LDFVLVFACLYVMGLFWNGREEEGAGIGGISLLILWTHIVALFFILDLLWLHFALSVFAV